MKGKIAIYTCITGNYDNLRQPAVTDGRFDFICFTGKGEKRMERDGVWEIREFEPEVPGQQDGRKTAGCPMSPGMRSRYPKMHPHLLLPEYEASVWIDGNIEILDDSLYKAALSAFDAGTLYAGVPHPSRDNVYSEAFMCMKMGHISRPALLRVCLWLFFHGMTRKDGLLENNLIFRRHLDPAVMALGRLWWSMLTRLCRRDQLSLAWCMKKTGIRPALLLPDGLNTRTSPGFRYRLHGD